MPSNVVQKLLPKNTQRIPMQYKISDVVYPAGMYGKCILKEIFKYHILFAISVRTWG